MPQPLSQPVQQYGSMAAASTVVAYDVTSRSSRRRRVGAMSVVVMFRFLGSG